MFETRKPPLNKGRRIKKINGFTQAVLIKHLLEGVYSIRELADITGLHPVTVTDYTRELHRVGAAHIDHWEKDNRGRDSIKVYKLGPGKDAKREKLTPAQRQARCREKARAIRMIQATAGAA